MNYDQIIPEAELELQLPGLDNSLEDAGLFSGEHLLSKQSEMEGPVSPFSMLSDPSKSPTGSLGSEDLQEEETAWGSLDLQDLVNAWENSGPIEALAFDSEEAEQALLSIKGDNDEEMIDVTNSNPASPTSSAAESLASPTSTSYSFWSPDVMKESRIMKTRSATRSLPKASVKIVQSSEYYCKPSSSVSSICEESILDKNKKNAVQAKLNREKKKKYISSLEDTVSSLSKENTDLKKQNKHFQKEKDVLEEELAYLRHVLANESALASVLSNLNNNSDVRLSSSFAATRKRLNTSHDHDYEQRPSKKMKKEMSGGVCLHVDGKEVSMEFCSSCAKMARGAHR